MLILQGETQHLSVGSDLLDVMTLLEHPSAPLVYWNLLAH